MNEFIKELYDYARGGDADPSNIEILINRTPDNELQASMRELYVWCRMIRASYYLKKDSALSEFERGYQTGLREGELE